MIHLKSLCTELPSPTRYRPQWRDISDFEDFCVTPHNTKETLDASIPFGPGVFTDNLRRPVKFSISGDHVHHPASDLPPTRPFKEILPEFYDLTINANVITLEKLLFDRLTIYATENATITECAIAKLIVSPSVKRLSLTNCLIGQLDLTSAILDDLVIFGGTVRTFRTQIKANPFTGIGSVSLFTEMPPTYQTKLASGAQSYSNMRKHAETLEMHRLALLFRHLELLSDKGTDGWLFRTFIWFNGTFSDHGHSPEKALVAALTTLVVTIAAIYVADGAMLGIAAEDVKKLTGWQATLSEPGLFARIARATLLTLQSINPFSFLEPRRLVVASNGTLAVAAACAGLLIDAFITLAAFAVRRRFKAT